MLLRTASRRTLAASVPARRLSSQLRVGVVGLGNMGGHMAHNLVRAGHRVAAFDISADAMAEASSRGVEVLATSPAEVAAESDVVVTMLPTPAHVRAVYAELIPAAAEGTLFVDSSTVDPSTAQAVARDAEAAGHAAVDAPVSGGVGGAEAGTLTFMVGGPDEAHARAVPVLKAMGSNVVHCGQAGTGQVAKIANNLVLAVSMVGVAEGMNLGARLGMDPKVLAGILNTSTGRCWSSDTYNPVPGVMDGVPSSRGYEGGFGVDLMLKDLGLAVQAASEARASVPLGSAARQLYGLVSAHGGGARDFSSVYEWLSSPPPQK